MCATHARALFHNTPSGPEVICRGLLGFGIGGEYPLSATICAEGTAPRRRGTLMAVVFSNQGARAARASRRRLEDWA